MKLKKITASVLAALMMFSAVPSVFGGDFGTALTVSAEESQDTEDDYYAGEIKRVYNSQHINIYEVEDNTYTLSGKLNVNNMDMNDKDAGIEIRYEVNSSELTFEINFVNTENAQNAKIASVTSGGYYRKFISFSDMENIPDKEGCFTINWSEGITVKSIEIINPSDKDNVYEGEYSYDLAGYNLYTVKLPDLIIDPSKDLCDQAEQQIKDFFVRNGFGSYLTDLKAPDIIYNFITPVVYESDSEDTVHITIYTVYGNPDAFGLSEDSDGYVDSSKMIVEKEYKIADAGERTKIIPKFSINGDKIIVPSSIYGIFEKENFLIDQVNLTIMDENGNTVDLTEDTDYKTNAIYNNQKLVSTNKVRYDIVLSDSAAEKYYISKDNKYTFYNYYIGVTPQITLSDISFDYDATEEEIIKKIEENATVDVNENYEDYYVITGSYENGIGTATFTLTDKGKREYVLLDENGNEVDSLSAACKVTTVKDTEEPVKPDKGEIIETTDAESNACNADLVINGEIGDAIALTEEEKNYVDNGGTIDVYLVATDITSSVSEKDKFEVESAISAVPNAKIGEYIDISLFKQYQNVKTQLESTNIPLTVKIKIPDSLVKENREFFIVRLHDDTASIIDLKDEGNNIYSFSSDKFSTYALAYTDKEEEPAPAPTPTVTYYSIANNSSSLVSLSTTSAAEGTTVNVSVGRKYYVVVTDSNGKEIAKISGTGSFTMPAGNVTVKAYYDNTLDFIAASYGKSYIRFYNSDNKVIRTFKTKTEGEIVINLGSKYAGKTVNIYNGKNNTTDLYKTVELDENGKATVEVENSKNYTAVTK